VTSSKFVFACHTNLVKLQLVSLYSVDRKPAKLTSAEVANWADISDPQVIYSDQRDPYIQFSISFFGYKLERLFST